MSLRIPLVVGNWKMLGDFASNLALLDGLVERDKPVEAGERGQVGKMDERKCLHSILHLNGSTFVVYRHNGTLMDRTN